MWLAEARLGYEITGGKKMFSHIILGARDIDMMI